MFPYFGRILVKSRIFYKLINNSMRTLDEYQDLFKKVDNFDIWITDRDEWYKQLIRELHNDIKNIGEQVSVSLWLVLWSLGADGIDIWNAIYEQWFDISTLSSPDIAPIMTWVSLTLMWLLMKKHSKYRKFKIKQEIKKTKMA